LSGLGTRAGVEAAELQRGQSQLLADIEARGQQKAFEDARMGFEAQKAREQQMATNVGKVGPALFQAGLAEQGALQTVGEQKRGLGQSALDEAYYRFLEEKQFPKQTLSDYSGMVYANPMAGLTTQTDTTTGTPFVPSTGQQIMGMGLAGLNVFGMGGGFSPGGFDASKIWGNTAKEGGPVLGRAEGGPVLSRQGGGAGEPRTIAEAREMGKNYFINKHGEKLAAVTKEELDASGLSLTEFLNQPPSPLSQGVSQPAPPLAPTPLEGDRPVTIGGLAERLGEAEREEYDRRQNEYEEKVAQNRINQLLKSTPWMQQPSRFTGPPKAPGLLPDISGQAPLAVGPVNLLGCCIQGVDFNN
jgi:hypothetical protein